MSKKGDLYKKIEQMLYDDSTKKDAVILYLAEQLEEALLDIEKIRIISHQHLKFR